MLTGKFPHAAGVPRNHMLLPLTEQTISAQLKRAGYRTGYIGKWHLDGHETPGFVPVARRRGFDYWAAYNVALYHLGDDPYELRNLVTVPTAAHKRDQLLTLLRRWMERISDRVLYTAPRNAAV
jgi:arylsulfatase A-like enzyme